MSALTLTSERHLADTLASSGYLGSLAQAMRALARDPRTIFVGQNVRYGGNRMAATFDGIPEEKRIEFPVAEDLQMGFCTGLALEGYIPVCIYPRMDFLLLALNQLVNHLDKICEMSAWRPKVIVRAAVGSRLKYATGPQHTQDHGTALLSMLKHIPVVRAERAERIEGIYRSALEYPSSSVVIEYMDKYDD